MEDAHKILSVHVEAADTHIKVSKVWSLENPSLPPAAVISVREKSKSWTHQYIDLDSAEALIAIRDAIDKLLSS